jgi:hypothetical protein
MVVTVSGYKQRLAVKVAEAAQFGVYRVPPKPNWLELYLYRMGIVALERNNTLDVLTDDEVRGITSVLELNL